MMGASGRIRELDGLRAVAVLLVFALHTSLLSGGAVGVDVFFVLSGWLITGILTAEVARTGGIDWRAFMLRRARRLIPALALLLIAYPFLAALLPARQPEPSWVSMLCAATFTSNFRIMTGTTPGPLSHTWTLALEWQFYLIWPAVIVAMRRLEARRATAILGGLWMALTVIRAVLFAAGLQMAAYYSPLHASGLVLGAAVALWPRLEARPWVGLVGLTLIVLAAVARFGADPFLPFAWEIPLAEVGAAMVIAAPPKVLAAEPLVRLGAISYGFYLWHVPILDAIDTLPIGGKAIASFALTTAVAALSFRYVERLFQRAGRPRPAAADASTLA